MTLWAILWSWLGFIYFYLTFPLFALPGFSDNEKECVIVWEKKPTVEEKAKADTLKLPPTFFCGICSDTDEDNGNAEDFQSELRKVQEAQVRLSLAFLLAQSPLLMAIN